MKTITTISAITFITLLVIGFATASVKPQPNNTDTNTITYISTVPLQVLHHKADLSLVNLNKLLSDN